MKFAVKKISPRVANNKKSVSVMSALLTVMLTVVSGFVNFAYRLNFDGVSGEVCAIFSIVTLTFYITTAVLAFSEGRKSVIIFGIVFWSISLVGAVFYTLQIITGATLDTLPHGIAFTRIIYALLTLPITAYSAIIEAARLYGVKLVLAFLPTMLFLAFYITALVSVSKKKSEE